MSALGVREGFLYSLLSLEEQRANAKLALKYVEVSRRYLAMGLGGEVVQIDGGAHPDNI